MRRALLALAAVALLCAPGVAAEAPAPSFPDPLLALLPGWIAEAESLASPHTSAPWYPEARAFLEGARRAHEEGRFRSALFDLESHAELIHAAVLMNESAPSDAERKSIILQRTGAWHAQAKGEWDAYRARLHGIEDDLTALRAAEMAMYSAEQALGARLLLDEREHVAREFPKQPQIERSYVLALVRTSHTAMLNFAWANDILDVVSQYEGIPPRLNETAWAALMDAALQPLPSGGTQMEALESLAAEIQAAEEGLLALIVNLAQQRAARAMSIYIIYGDAASRRDTLTDATRALGKQLNNTTQDDARAYGLLGVFTADAIDRADKTLEFAREGRLEMGVVISTWASLDHQKYVTATLAAASPVHPAPPSDRPIPAAPWAALAALAVAVLLLRRR